MAMVNTEKLVRDYLAADTGVAALVGTRVYTHLPASPTFPLVVLSRFAGGSTVWGHLDEPRLQIEAWAEKGQRPACESVGEAVRSAMKSVNIRGSRTGGVVSGTTENLYRWFPDPVTERPRYLLDVTVYAHP